jgi:hypothetical protein
MSVFPWWSTPVNRIRLHPNLGPGASYPWDRKKNTCRKGFAAFMPAYPSICDMGQEAASGSDEDEFIVEVQGVGAANRAVDLGTLVLGSGQQDFHSARTNA